MLDDLEHDLGALELRFEAPFAGFEGAPGGGDGPASVRAGAGRGQRHDPFGGRVDHLVGAPVLRAGPLAVDVLLVQSHVGLDDRCHDYLHGP